MALFSLFIYIYIYIYIYNPFHPIPKLPSKLGLTMRTHNSPMWAFTIYLYIHELYFYKAIIIIIIINRKGLTLLQNRILISYWFFIYTYIYGIWYILKICKIHANKFHIKLYIFKFINKKLFIYISISQFYKLDFSIHQN